MKPGYKTTEFWLALGAACISGGLGYLETVQAPWAMVSVTIISSIYAILRAAGKAKQ